MPQINGWSEDEIEERSNTLAAKIQRAWRRIVSKIFSIGGSGPSGVITLADLNDLPDLWSQHVDGDVIGYVGQTLLDGAERVFEDARAAGIDVSHGGIELTEDFVEEYLKAATNRLVGIGNDVWVTVKSHLLQAYNLNESPEEIAARVKHVTGVSDGRAMTIARTEIHGALEAGSYEQALLVDPNGKKIWLATEDERTRPTHRAADGQSVRIMQPFMVGGAPLAYPGDPAGPPGETINCRCTTIFDLEPETMSDEEINTLLSQETVIAAGAHKWEPTEHPRGNDGKFISKGSTLYTLLSKANGVITTKEVISGISDLDNASWSKLTPDQKAHIMQLAIGHLGKDANLTQKLDHFNAKEDVTISVDDILNTPKNLVTPTDLSSVVSNMTPEEWHAISVENQGKLLQIAVTKLPFDSPAMTQLHRLTQSKPKATEAVPEVKPKSYNLSHTGKKFVPATIYKQHDNGAVIAVNDEGNERLRWDANFKKYLRQRVNSDGKWVLVSAMSKKDSYNLVQTSDWWTPSEKKNVDVVETKPVGTSYISKETVQEAKLELPKKIVASLKNTVPGDVYKNYKDGEIVAITANHPDIPSNKKQRLRWNETKKKYEHEQSLDNGETWTSIGPLSKKDAYDFLKIQKNSGLWRRPEEQKVQAQAPTNKIAPQVTPKPVAPGLPPASSEALSAVDAPGSVHAVMNAGIPDGQSLTFVGKAHSGVSKSPIYKDANGQRWILKKPFSLSDKSNFDLDIASNRLQTMMGLKGPATYKVIGPNGEPYVAQAMFDGKDAFPNGKFDPNKLSAYDVKEMQKQQIHDWLIGNNDAHSGNFLRLPNGEITGIDKGHALRFYGKDKLSPNYKPWSPTGNNKHTYPDMWQAYANGEHIEMNDPNQGEIGAIINQTMDIPDAEIKDLFRPYVEQAVKYGRFPEYGNNVEKVLDGIAHRKNNLRHDFDKLYQDTKKQRETKLNKSLKKINDDIHINETQTPEFALSPGAKRSEMLKQLTKAYSQKAPGEVLASGVDANGKKVNILKSQNADVHNPLVEYWEEKPYTALGYEKISTVSLNDAPKFLTAKVVNWDTNSHGDLIDVNENKNTLPLDQQPLKTQNEFLSEDLLNKFSKASFGDVLLSGWDKNGNEVQLRKTKSGNYNVGQTGYVRVFTWDSKVNGFKYTTSFNPNNTHKWMTSPTDGGNIAWDVPQNVKQDYNAYLATQKSPVNISSSELDNKTENASKISFTDEDFINDWQSVYDLGVFQPSNTALAYTSDGEHKLVYHHGSGMLSVQTKISDGSFIHDMYVNPSQPEFALNDELGKYGRWVHASSFEKEQFVDGPTPNTTSAPIQNTDKKQLAADLWTGLKNSTNGQVIADGKTPGGYTYILKNDNGNMSLIAQYQGKDTPLGTWTNPNDFSAAFTVNHPINHAEKWNMHGTLSVPKESSEPSGEDLVNGWFEGKANQVLAEGVDVKGKKYVIKTSPSLAFIYATPLDSNGNEDTVYMKSFYTKTEFINWFNDTAPGGGHGGGLTWSLPNTSSSPASTSLSDTIWNNAVDSGINDIIANGVSPSGKKFVIRYGALNGNLYVIPLHPKTGLEISSEAKEFKSKEDFSSWMEASTTKWTLPGESLSNQVTSAPTVLPTSFKTADDIWDVKNVYPEANVIATYITPIGTKWALLHNTAGNIALTRKSSHDPSPVVKGDATSPTELSNLLKMWGLNPTSFAPKKSVTLNSPTASPSSSTPSLTSMSALSNTLAQASSPAYTGPTIHLADGTVTPKGLKVKAWGPFTKKSQYVKNKPTIIAHRFNGTERIVYKPSSFASFHREKWDDDQKKWISVQSENSKIASLIPKGTLWYAANDVNVTSKPSGSSLPKPSPLPTVVTNEQIAQTVGVDTSLANYSQDVQNKIYSSFKALPGTYTHSTPETIFEAVKTVAASHGVSKIDALKIIDNIGAKGQTNQHLFENKIISWLSTPQGYAQAHGIKHVPPTPSFLDDNIGHHLIPSFEESSKYKYETISSMTADKYWHEMVAAHGVPLSVGQKSGVKAYTGSTYSSINTYLWGDTAQITESHKVIMNNIQKAMRPSLHPIRLHRGVSYKALGVKNLNDLYGLVGQTRISEGFNSTSVGGTAAMSGNITLEIEAPPGTPMVWAKPFSHYSGENEMLLPAGMHYKIISVLPGTFKNIVKVRIVPPPAEGDAGSITASIRFER